MKSLRIHYFHLIHDKILGLLVKNLSIIKIFVHYLGFLGIIKGFYRKYIIISLKSQVPIIFLNLHFLCFEIILKMKTIIYT